MPKASNSDVILSESRLQRVRSGFIHRSSGQRHLGHHDRYTWTHQQYDTMESPVYQLASDHTETSCTVKVAPARKQTSHVLNGGMVSNETHQLLSPHTEFAPKCQQMCNIRKLVLPSNSPNANTSNLSDSTLKRDFSLSNDSVTHSTPIRAGRNLVLHNDKKSNVDIWTKMEQKQQTSGHKSKTSKSSLFNTRDLCYVLLPSLLAFAIVNVYVFQLLDINFLQFDIDTLNNSLQRDVFGQHIATTFIPQALKEYLHDENNTHPLILSFHGWTGIGKTHVANILANSLAASNSLANVRTIIPMHISQLVNISVSSQINKLFTSRLYYHLINLFIVDDIDKMPPAFVDSLRNLLGNLNATTMHGNDTKVIVLLLSNSGGTEINKYVLNHLKSGHTRESIQHKDVVKTLWQNTTNQWYIKWQNNTGFHWFIPFLPLEYIHLSSCIERHLASRNITVSDDITESVLKQINFFPEQSPLFSNTGCRQVAEKVNVLLELDETSN